MKKNAIVVRTQSKTNGHSKSNGHSKANGKVNGHSKASGKNNGSSIEIALIRFLESSSRFWHRESNRNLTPQGVPTMESRIAAAKSKVMRELLELVRDPKQLEHDWDDDGSK